MRLLLSCRLSLLETCEEEYFSIPCMPSEYQTPGTQYHSCGGRFTHVSFAASLTLTTGRDQQGQGGWGAPAVIKQHSMHTEKEKSSDNVRLQCNCGRLLVIYLFILRKVGCFRLILLGQTRGWVDLVGPNCRYPVMSDQEGVTSKQQEDY